MLKKLTDDLIGDLHIMIILLLTKLLKNGEDGEDSWRGFMITDHCKTYIVSSCKSFLISTWNQTDF